MAAGFEDGRGGHGIRERGQILCIEMPRLDVAGIERPAAVDKLFEGNVAVARLAVEVAVLVRGVAHVKRVEPLDLAGGVVGHVVAAAGLVDANLAARGQVVEVLAGVHAGTLRGRPRGGEDAHGALLIDRVPVARPGDEQRDGVLGAGRAPDEPRGDAERRGGRNAHGTVAQRAHHGVAHVDVVAVEVVGDVRVGAGPGAERPQLVLGLGHVGVKVVEVAELPGAEAGVCVGRVEALVVLDEDVDALCARAPQQLLVVGQALDGRLGDEDVDAAVDGVEGDVEVRRVRGEDCDCVAGREGVDGGLVGSRVAVGVGGERVEGRVEVVVDLGDVAVEMGAWRAES